MGYSFEITSSIDLLNELSCRVDDYNNNNLSSGKAVVCSIFCWHLVEWIYHEYDDQLSEFKRLRDFQEYVKKHVFRYLLFKRWLMGVSIEESIDISQR